MSEAKQVKDMSPEERSERLAELNARRRARLRKAAIGTGIGVAALLLVVLIAAYDFIVLILRNPLLLDCHFQI